MLVIFSEKTVCFELSTGNSSAQSISNLTPSSFHHGLTEQVSRPYSRTHNFCSVRIWLCAHASPWLENSVRMSKVGVFASSTKTLLTQLKVTTLGLGCPLRNTTDYNSRSGASPLSLYHSSQKVNLSAKTKIKKEKRKVKNLITRTRTQISLPPSQKRCH